MVKYNDSARHISRPPPCPAYDIPGTEAWLEAMALEGRILDSDGIFLGFASFELAEPQRIRYRLQPAKRGKQAFDEGAPDEAEQDFNESFGWEYVARRGEFHIYRCLYESAPELNTDPLVHAQALKAVRRRMRESIISMLLFLIVYPVLALQLGLLTAALHLGSWLVFLWLISCFESIWQLYAGARAIKRYQQALVLGCPAQREAPKSYLNFALRCGSLVLTVTVIVAALALLLTGRPEKALADYEGDIPFASTADFAPEAEHQYRSVLDIKSTVSRWTDPLAQDNIQLYELAELHFPDGGTVNISCDINYHETRAGFLAAIMAREYSFNALFERGRERVVDIYVDADYCNVWKLSHGQIIVIQKDNKVLRAYVNQISLTENGNPVPLYTIAEVLCESLED